LPLLKRELLKTMEPSLTAETIVTTLPDPSERITRAFQTIAETRMRDLPFLNKALSVEAVGFFVWNHMWLGVLIAPWTMNLIATPYDPRHWTHHKKGGTTPFSFPFGNYDFTLAHEPLMGAGLYGAYLMCSLFSPASQFVDHEAAHQTAREVLKTLFVVDPDHVDEFAPLNPPSLDERLKEPLSKRDFLRGRFLKKTTP
jgi:[NiFe] hydrogenase assembly HybE family chaperone